MARGKRPFSRLVSAALGAVLLGFSLGNLLATDAPKGPTTAPATQAASTQPKPVKTKIDEDYALNFLQQREPELYKDAMLLKDKDPKKYADLLKDLLNEVRGLVDLQHRDAPMFDLTMDDRRLAYKALQLSKELRDKALKPEDRDSLQTQLTQVVTQQFEVRQKMRQLDLEEKEKRLADVQRKIAEQQSQLDDREKNKDNLINQRVADLLKKTPRVEW